MERFEDLGIWKLSRELYKAIFDLSSREPFFSDFKLRDQIRASSGSISDNIAEGFERGGNREFIQFLYIAKGSCGETRNQVYRSFDCRYISDKEMNDILDRTLDLSRQISNFIRYLKNSGYKGEKYI